MARGGWRRGAGVLAGSAGLLVLACFFLDLDTSDSGTLRAYTVIPMFLEAIDIRPAFAWILIAMIVTALLAASLFFSRTPRFVATLTHLLGVLVLLAFATWSFAAAYLEMESGAPSIGQWLLGRTMGGYVILVAMYMTALNLLFGHGESTVTLQDQHVEAF